MKLLLIVFAAIAAVVVVGSFYADYKLRQWMTARRRDREHRQ
ncbi:MAG TPA: hypothetical protein VFI20_03335 [Terracidiphilus sp.]|nr:hypothetical protein [Terracidiphilus sp.]